MHFQSCVNCPKATHLHGHLHLDLIRIDPFHDAIQLQGDPHLIRVLAILHRI